MQKNSFLKIFIYYVFNILSVCMSAGQKRAPDLITDGKLLYFLNVFIYYVYNILSVCMPAGQKRAPDLITDGCEPPCCCWD